MSGREATIGRPILWLCLPLVVLAGIVAALLFANPLDGLTASAPPVENVSVESVRLTPGRILLSVRADGSEPVQIAQIQVDGACRHFTQDPAGAIDVSARPTS